MSLIATGPVGQKILKGMVSLLFATQLKAWVLG